MEGRLISTAVLVLSLLTSGCNARRSGPSVPDLSGAIEGWLEAEYPETDWQNGGGSSSWGGEASDFFENDQRFRTDQAPVADDLCARLRAFVEGEIGPRVTSVVVFSAQEDRFNLGYHDGHVRGGIVVFACRGGDGGLDLVLVQYEIG